ncbi:MAG: hypothetical protein KFB96_10090 [Thiocapsa sp.]|uniref:hypothetical protein n=1 Tax=Thiocapsa sp. TaxID=2024551 RepID=UPI001BCFB91F|nr:hypothetical protein [Thiocapsa sp.]QVL50718.1 MAG: hypothetical protein KFB96_10090 [Thiocapsa sp.]
MMKQISVFLVVLVFSFGQVLAASFSGADVDRFILTYQQLITIIDFDEEDEDDFDENGEEIDIFNLQILESELMAMLAEHPEAPSMIRAGGYRSERAFASQAAVILRAFYAHSFGQGLDQLERSLQEMSEEDRAMTTRLPIMQQIDNLRSQLADVPPADLQTIHPYLDQLQALLVSDDDAWDDDSDD